MSESYRFVRIAAGGIAALFLWEGLVASAQQEGSPVTNKEQSAPHAEGNNALQLPVAQQSEKAPYRADYGKACSNPKDREEADLCQQWRSANAAGEALRVARNQFWISLVESLLLVGTLVLSGWAALAASSAARTARRELEELERPHLLLHFDDHGVEIVDGVSRVTGETVVRLHNYGRSPGFVVAMDAQFHFRKPEDGMPEPVSWIKKPVRIFSFGSIVRPDGDSEAFRFRARDDISEADEASIGKEGIWYFHGFAGYHDTMRGLFTVGFCYELEEGEWRISAAPAFSDNQKYNYSERHKRRSFVRRSAHSAAKRAAAFLRSLANALSPK